MFLCRVCCCCLHFCLKSQNFKVFSSQKYAMTALSAVNKVGLSAAAGFQVCAFITHHLKWNVNNSSTYCPLFFAHHLQLAYSSHHIFSVCYLTYIVPNILILEGWWCLKIETIGIYCLVFGRTQKKKCRQKRDRSMTVTVQPQRTRRTVHTLMLMPHFFEALGGSWKSM